MQMFASLDKANPDTGNVRGLNLAAVKHTTVQVTGLPLYQERLRIGHGLLYYAWTDRSLVYIVYTFNNM
jgi:hypothetical protein